MVVKQKSYSHHHRRRKNKTIQFDERNERIDNNGKGDRQQWQKQNKSLGKKLNQ
jgi:hypothetical protein